VPLSQKPTFLAKVRQRAPRVDSSLGIAIAHVSSGGIRRLERASQAPAGRPACAHDAGDVVSASTGLAARRGLCRVRNPRPVGAADRDDATRPSPTTDLFWSLLTSRGVEVLAVRWRRARVCRQAAMSAGKRGRRRTCPATATARDGWQRRRDGLSPAGHHDQRRRTTTGTPTRRPSRRTPHASPVAPLSGNQAPLVLAGVRFLQAIYHQANTHPRLLATGVDGSPRDMSPDQLHHRVWPLVEPVLRGHEAAAAIAYRALQGTGRTSSESAEVLLASNRDASIRCPVHRHARVAHQSGRPATGAAWEHTQRKRATRPRRGGDPPPRLHRVRRAGITHARHQSGGRHPCGTDHGL
jgi:hypothetical protein